MFFINKLNKFYTIIFTVILFLNTILFNYSYASSFKISEIEVSEKFDLKFNKKKVFDKAFKSSFSQLTSMITTHSDKKKLEKTPISIIKSLIDSFNVSDERFVDNKYFSTETPSSFTVPLWDGTLTNKPLEPSITLKPSMSRRSSIVTVTKAFNFEV